MRVMSDVELDKLIAQYEREELARGEGARASDLSGLGGFSFKSLFKTAAKAAVGFVTGGPVGAAVGVAQGFAEQKADKAMKSAQRVAEEQAAAGQLTARGVNMRNPTARAINKQMVARARIEKTNRDKLIKIGLSAAFGVGALYILLRGK